MTCLIERDPLGVSTREALCSQAIIECPFCRREVVTFVRGSTSDTLWGYHVLRCPRPTQDEKPGGGLLLDRLPTLPRGDLMPKTLRTDAPIRSVTEVGSGDFVKVGTEWKRITTNSAAGETRTPRSWGITTEDGKSLGMFDISRYARASDLEDK